MTRYYFRLLHGLLWSVVCHLSVWAESPLKSQLYRFEPFRPPDGFNFENGYDIEVAPGPRLWFASWGSGIGELDEQGWRRYSKAGSMGLPSNFVRSITYDSVRDVLWAATSGGLAVLVGDRVVQPDLPPGFEPSSILLFDNGRVWVGSCSGQVVTGVLRGEPFEVIGAWETILESGPDNGSCVDDMVQAKDGSVWIARNRTGVVRIRGAEIQRFPPSELRIERSNQLLATSHSGVVVSGSDSPAVYRDGQWSSLSWVRAISRTALSLDDRFFYGTRRGELLFDCGDHTEFMWASTDTNNKIRDIVTDENQRIWLALKEGIIKGEPSRWINTGLAGGFSSRFLGNACIVTRSGEVLGLNPKNELVRYVDGESDWVSLLTLPSPQAFRQRMVETSGEALWILNGTFLHRVTMSDWVLSHTVEAPTRSRITGLQLYGEDGLVISSEAGAFLLREGDWTPLGHPVPIYSIAVSPDSDVIAMVGTDGVELWRSGEISWTWEEPWEQAGRRFEFIEATTNYGFISSVLGLGLFVLEDGQIARSLEDRALRSARCTAAMQASNGDLWVGFDGMGVARRRGDRWVNYGYDDGLQRDAVVGFLERPNGQIWVLTEDFGTYAFNPDSDPPNTEILSAPDELSLGQSATLAFGGSDAWNRTMSGELVYSWRIRESSEPVEKENAWSRFVPDSSLGFHAPSQPGDYVFEVRAQDREFNVDPSPAVHSFTVLPPVWGRPFIAAPMLGMSGLVTFLAFRAIRSHVQLKRRKNELDLRVAKRTHQLSQASNRLREEKEMLEATIFSTADAIIAVDANRCVVLFNTAAQSLSGVERHDAIGRPVESVLTLTDLVSDRSVFDRLLEEDGPFSGIVVLRSGRSIGGEFEYSAAKIKSETKRGAWVLALRDRAHLKALESERFRNSRLESLGLMAGGIAHDFNNYLTSILGNISFAKELIPDGSEVKEVLSQSEAASVTAQSLTKQLLTFSKGGIPDIEETDLKQIIRNSAEFCSRGRPHACEIEIEEDLFSVVVDVGLITQVIQNIVLNAMQAMDEGGRVRITAKNIRWKDSQRGRAGTDASPLKNGIRLSVSDRGGGISAADLDHVFDPYFTTKPSGTGLGLSVCYSVVSQHGGHIQIDSTEGKGTTVSIELPAVLRKPSERLKTVAKTAPDPERKGGLRILIMDDDSAIIRLLTRIINRLGHTVASVENGHKALEIIDEARGAGEAFDACVLDLTIPGSLGGKEVAQELRNRFGSIYLIASSGYSKESARNLCERGIFDHLLPKPYTVKDVEACLAEIEKRS